MSYSHPFQLLCTIPATTGPDVDIVIAASGPELVSFKAGDGNVITRWTSTNRLELDGTCNGKAENGASKVKGAQDNVETNEPRGQKRKRQQMKCSRPNVIKLVSVPLKRQFIAVTGDDKCLRVFSVDGDGSFTEQSSRCMPKRPCAISTDPEGTTIFCADKFGDVFGLPLQYDPQKESSACVVREETPAAERIFKPAANNKTVHTRRNLQALENQLKQKGRGKAPKEGPSFEHKLLLGHVSMLTDILYASTNANGKEAAYLITADRDEHLRITRGPPQTHVIERFCLGHTEYISKTCLVAGTNLLVSGGGDDWLGVWDWTTGALVAKHHLRSVLDIARQGAQPLPEGENYIVAVSGLYCLPMRDDPARLALLVCFEKQDFVVLYDCSQLEDDGVQATSRSFKNEGVLLDVAITGSAAVASFDTRSVESQRLRALNVTNGSSGGVDLEILDDRWLAPANAIEAQHPVDDPSLDSLLCGIGDMRKRGEEDGNDEE